MSLSKALLSVLLILVVEYFLLSSSAAWYTGTLVSNYLQISFTFTSNGT